MGEEGKPLLEGIKVVEWARQFAGPAAGEFLAELGADVIKVEERKIGDLTRATVRKHGLPAVLPGGLTIAFQAHNRSKKGITLDLKKSEGREVMYRLVEKSDVFITNMRRKAIEKLGMNYEVLRGHNRRLIYLMVSGYGPKGPDVDLPAVDPLILGRSGVMMLQKRPEDDPNSMGRDTIADSATSTMGVCGVLGALYARERTGLGQQINVSILGSLAGLYTNAITFQCMTGQTFPYLDRRKAYNPLSNTYKTGDGKWFVFGMSRSDPVWPAFCRAVGIEQYEKDPKFENQKKREENREELVAILDRVFAQRPRAEWLQRFREWDLFAQGINTLEELVTDPQMIENEYIVTYDHPVLGSVKVLGCPVEFSQSPSRIVSAPPELGQHTEEVLLSMGYSWEDIAQLQEKEVI